MVHELPQPDLAKRAHTFDVFAKGTIVFAAHILVIRGALALAFL